MAFYKIRYHDYHDYDIMWLHIMGETADNEISYRSGLYILSSKGFVSVEGYFSFYFENVFSLILSENTVPNFSSLPI